MLALTSPGLVALALGHALERWPVCPQLKQRPSPDFPARSFSCLASKRA